MAWHNTRGGTGVAHGTQFHTLPIRSAGLDDVINNNIITIGARAFGENRAEHIIIIKSTRLVRLALSSATTFVYRTAFREEL